MRVHRHSSTIPVPPDRVFAALTDPDALAVWLPPAGTAGTFERFTPGPGGGFRLVLRFLDPASGPGKAGDGSDVVEARIVEVVDGTRVVWATDFVSDDPAFAGTMTMTWTIEPDDRGSRLTVTARDVPPGISQEDHSAGMRSSSMQLWEYLVRGVVG